MYISWYFYALDFRANFTYYSHFIFFRKICHKNSNLGCWQLVGKFFFDKAPYLPNSLRFSSGWEPRSCNNLSRFRSSSTLSRPLGLEPLDVSPSAVNSGLRMFWVGVVAKEAETCWCLLVIRGEFLGDPKVCLEPGGSGGGGGGLDEPSLVATVCLLPLLQEMKNVKF